MSWSPQRWAVVWASRLECYAEHHRCQEAFASSVASCANLLRAAMPTELFALCERAAPVGRPADLCALGEQLNEWVVGSQVSGERSQTQPPAIRVPDHPQSDGFQLD
jgi:hypothetical protein